MKDASTDGDLIRSAGVPPQEDTWHHLELSTDWATRCAVLSSDGTPTVDGELDGTGVGIARVDLFTVEKVTCYLDAIEIEP